MPGEGLTHGPRAVKKARGRNHRFSRIIRHSLRDGLRLIARSPWEPGFLAPITSEIISRRLGLSVGRSGPHAFAVRADDARRASSSRPSRPASRSLTIGQNALYNRGGMARPNHIFTKNGSKIFCARGPDSRISVESAREFRFFAHGIFEVLVRPP